MDYLFKDLKDADVNGSLEGNKSIKRPELACGIHAVILREDAFGKQHGACGRGRSWETVPDSCPDSAADELCGARPGSALLHTSSSSPAGQIRLQDCPSPFLP